ncbi:MAG: nucleoside deaminase [Pseudodesulfovibrio sp.]|uniref:nucleoside deaminase n=1 Tax=Pseudodesulfovibrio sp. TaxID=2035812 RepID=UPI003D13CE8A
MRNLKSFMETALEEAMQSLRQGNHGFGAVIVRDGAVVATAHDTEETDRDATAHAEMNAIRKASALLGRDLSGCTLVATHEPCPMCATAIMWSGISALAFGYSIRDAIRQGRRRIDLPCETLFDKGGAPIEVTRGVLFDECSLLYDRSVREEIRRLRNATPEDLTRLDEALTGKRLAWFADRKQDYADGSPLDRAYRLLLDKFGVPSEEMPVVSRTDRSLVFHSGNFCPTLEACRILGLDTRQVCKQVNEHATDQFIKQIHPGLSFSRNYALLRPHAPYCEESITLTEEP